MPLSIWSNTLPGVPTTICTLCLSSLICSLKGCFPNIAAHLTFFILPILESSSLTWIANSLVGVKTRHCTFFSSIFIFSQTGIPKLAVLPLPVWDLTIISSPFNNFGIEASWTSDGFLYPKLLSALIISSLKFNSLNFIYYVYLLF